MKTLKDDLLAMFRDQIELLFQQLQFQEWLCGAKRGVLSQLVSSELANCVEQTRR